LPGRSFCVGYSEIDKYAKKIYQKHYPEHKDFGDARRIIPSNIPDFDLLVGGFPCQTFSIAGKRAGFDDARGTLFFEIARILRDKRPGHFLLENVGGLLSHDDRKTIVKILEVLSDIGYRVEWQLLNTKNFGLPQNRPRVFIVGHLRGQCTRQIFPLGQGGEVSKRQDGGKQKSGQRICSTIDTRYGALRNAGETYIQVGTLRTYKDGQGFRAMGDNKCPALTAQARPGGYASPVIISPALNARAREDGSGQPVIISSTQKHATVMENQCSALTGGHIPMMIQRGHGFNKGGVKELPCLRASSMEHNDFVFDGYKVRRLTPVECERLQGFPDNWTEGISDTQRYKCIGNAVSTPVISAIISALFEGTP